MKNINICNLIEKIKKYFKISKSTSPFVGLVPTENADEDGGYANALEYAMKNNEIKNIAVAGPYGSGKSSVIKSFFSKKNNKKYRPIYVSLATFNNGNDSDAKEEEKNEFYRALEKSVLQQIIYQAKDYELPLSRFKRLGKHSKISILLITASFIAFLFTTLFFLFPKCLSALKYNYELLDKELNSGVINFLFAIACMAVLYGVYMIIFYFTKRVSLSKLKLKDAEIEITDSKESIFNKYLEEILYFFEVTKYKVLIIEDLDRYDGDALIVFQKLRELNTLLNASKQIKKNIKFIYAIKDDFFTNYEERTKFFDYIVPIIPISSLGNCNENMWERLKKNDLINTHLNKTFIDDIAFFIEDQRLIDNIVNEYIIYSQKIDNKFLDEKQLFSIVVYKNLCPEKFAELQKEEGKIVKLFENKNDYVEAIIKAQKARKKEILEEKEIVIDENLKNIEELKYLLISTIYKYGERYNYERKFKLDDRYVSIDEFLSEDIGYNEIENALITFSTPGYTQVNLDEKKVFQYFENKSGFLKRWERLENRKQQKLEMLQVENESIDEKIKIIKKYSLKQLLKEYDLEYIFKEVDEVEKFFVSRGYITEEYKSYITIFREGNLNRRDNEFIASVKTQKAWLHNLDLLNVKNILLRLDEQDYEVKEIANLSLIKYLIQNDLMDKLLKIIHTIDKEDSEILHFIDEFLEKNISENDLCEKFIKVLTENSKKLWEKIYTRNGDNQYLDKWVVNFLKNKNSLENVNNTFKEYIENHKTLNELVLNEDANTIISSLEFLNIKLKNINNASNKELLQEVFNKKLYELNSNMINLMLEINGIDFRNFEKQNLTLIFSNETLKEHVLENFKEYYDNCYTLHESNLDEEIVIIELINSDFVERQIKEEIIKNELFNQYNINDVPGDFYELLLINDKVKVSYENVLKIFSSTREISESLINHISKHVIEYKNSNIDECVEIYEEDFVSEFKQKYLTNEKVLQKDFEMMAMSLKTKVEDITALDNHKIEFLVKENLVVFNQTNCDYIRENAGSVFIKYITNNIEEYIENINTFVISGYEDRILMNNQISFENKKVICENTDLTDLEANTCLYLIKNDIVDVEKEIIEKIFFSKDAKFDDKMAILEKYIENSPSKEDVLNALKMIKDEYNGLDFSRTRCQIPYNIENVNLCNILISKGIISSFAKGKHNNIIIFNKRSE